MFRNLLGINARNIEFVMKENNRELYKYADDKIISKEIFIKHGIPTPKLIAQVETQLLADRFINDVAQSGTSVVKPARGFGGAGIMVINDVIDGNFHCAGNEILGSDDVLEHTVNILYGAYSMDGNPDVAFAEEKIVFDDSLSLFAQNGLPDIRIIVFRGKPVAAMIRTATKKSKGKANLHAGGMAIGIDMKTGKTQKGWFNKTHISHHPDNNENLMGITIPHWKKVLEIAGDIYDFIGLGYMGVDITLDRNLGPMVLEINARPGLEIQNVLGHGLREVLA